MPEPKVTLITDLSTPNPIRGLYQIWQASKTEEELDWIVHLSEMSDARDGAAIEGLFRAIIAQEIPCAAMVQFVFMLENVSVSWREQAVRHKIGAVVDDRIGFDIVPDLATSNYWSQSMRIQDMGHFAANGAYRRPPILDEWKHGDDDLLRALANRFDDHMFVTQNLYRDLVEAGMQMEDAREIIPLGAQHRISWALNLQTLMRIVGKRGCWILQLGLWGPIIEGMINELADKVHPIFRELVTPPCVKRGTDEWTGCVFHEENRRRVTGEDQMPLCPLYREHEMTNEEIQDHADRESSSMRNYRLERTAQYQTFWGRDPYSGERDV